jgi:hypothetical protein
MIQASLRKLLQTNAIDCNCKNGQNVIHGSSVAQYGEFNWKTSGWNTLPWRLGPN